MVSKNINEPFTGLFQVRIVRKGIEYSQAFNVSTYGSREAAITAAENWRDEMLQRLPKYGGGLGSFRNEPLSHKRSWGRVGISRYIHHDHRRHKAAYIRFGVNWTDSEGYPRIKSFEAGRVESVTWEQELHASMTAEAFRSEWEYCQEHGLVFDEHKYEDWKDAALYPFSPSADLA